MANFLRRPFTRFQPLRSSPVCSTMFWSSSSSSSSADALVEIKPGEVGMVSGIPQEHLRRRVIIYSPARTASQQGSGKVGKWRINFLSTQKWENPLMGWTSTGDPLSNVGEAGLSFDSVEAAKAFAEKHGWEYTVYVDDVIIKSKRATDHMEDLRKFFNRLRRYNLKLNPAKCAFGVPAGKLLGFIVSRRGIELDPSKVKKFHTPLLKQLRFEPQGIQEWKQNAHKPKSYADNFKWKGPPPESKGG